jgi:bidirectional [NiFe] hydrogenase diaphorase subunit
MPAPIAITIDGQELKVETGHTILEVCRAHGIDLPTLCHLDGLSKVGACRLCVVEIEGSPRLFPACTTPVAAKQVIATNTPKLRHYRRMIVELFFAERNHVCAVCVANGACELQNLGYRVGLTHVRFPYLFPDIRVDASHPEYVFDQNRCVRCTRCVRVCDEVEGAHNWDVSGRGVDTRIIADFNQPWGESTTCTSCGKCLEACPTGALWSKNDSLGTLRRLPARIAELVAKRKPIP